jgi:hypothetical protein
VARRRTGGRSTRDEASEPAFVPASSARRDGNAPARSLDRQQTERRGGGSCTQEKATGPAERRDLPRQAAAKQPSAGRDVMKQPPKPRSSVDEPHPGRPVAAANSKRSALSVRCEPERGTRCCTCERPAAESPRAETSTPKGVAAGRKGLLKQRRRIRLEHTNPRTFATCTPVERDPATGHLPEGTAQVGPRRYG